MWTTDKSLTSLLRPSDMNSSGELESWETSQPVDDGMTWEMDPDEHGTLTLIPESLSHELLSKSGPKPDSCCCLLSAMSFLERLTSIFASQENRIDLLLADVRNSIETLSSFISCEACAARVEQNMLLAMAARQISVLCGKTANCYRAMHLCGRGDSTSSQQKVELGASTGPIDISVSTYRATRRELTPT